MICSLSASKELYKWQMILIRLIFIIIFLMFNIILLISNRFLSIRGVAVCQNVLKACIDI